MLKNNHEKFLFFVYTTFETLKKLFWVPDIIVCNDWQMALLGQLIKEKFKDDKLYSKIKTVSFVHSYINLFETLDSHIVPFRDYAVPFLIRDIQKLHETYLI